MSEEILLRLQTPRAYIPFELAEPVNFLIAAFFLTALILVRYFAAVSAFYFTFWKGSLAGGVFKKLHELQAPRGQIQKEIKWSALSSVIFAVAAIAMGISWQKGWSLIYTDFDQFGLWWLPASFVILSLVHELYFYWTHVWMHHPRLYRKVHAIHHNSVKTSPWASFSFHPWEALTHAAFLPLAVFVIPLHPVVILTYLVFMTVTAISNHLGVELIPFKAVTAFFISGRHHSVHHKNMKKNFGLYYTFSDKLFGTEEKQVE